MPERNGWHGRSVLVTGATGIVGSWLCEALLAAGASVVAFVRDDDPQSRLYREHIVERCTVVRGDLADERVCSRAINDYEVDTVFHLGAQTIVGAAFRDPLDCFESNIRGTYHLLEAARRLTPLVKAFIVASSDKAYGSSAVLPYTEDMPLHGTHPYDVSKSCTDLLATTYARTYGLPAAIARCGNIYGGGDLNWSRIVPGTIRSLLAGEAPIVRSNGKYTRDYIYVKDVVGAYLTLAERVRDGAFHGEAFNFSPQRSYTVLEIVQAVCDQTGVDLKPVILDTAQGEIRDQVLDASKARRELNWSAVYDLASGLRETVLWYRGLLGEREREGAHA
jgi:CDP-glucose 4,6-dehydratase